MKYTASVIGGGFGGGLSLAALAQSDRYSLCALADPDPGAGRRHQSRYPGMDVFPDADSMLRQRPTDVVCVSSPAPTHDTLAYEVMKTPVRGILVEKPLACSVDRAQSLLDQCKESRLPVVVPHGMFALPAQTRILEAVRDGALGPLVSITVQNKVDLMNAGIHWLAFILALLDGDPPVTVKADFDTSTRRINDGMHVETSGVSCFETAGGVRVTLESGEGTILPATRFTEERQRGAFFTLTGTNGVIEFYAWAPCFWIRTGSADGGRIVEASTLEEHAPHQWYLDQLAGRIDANEPDYTVPNLSLDALKLIAAAYRSGVERCRVDVDSPDPATSADSEWPIGKPVAEKHE